MTEILDDLVGALGAPFPAEVVKFKPGNVSGNRALALAHIDARTVQDRLDEVLGIAGWEDDYTCMPDGTVVCRLRVRLGGEWVTKVDVGAPSQQPEEGARRKAAFSGALKRAAVKVGVGRYLYKLGRLYADYDPQKKTWAKPPTLPLWADGLTTEERVRLVELLRESEADPARFCKAFGEIRHPLHLCRSMYPKAVQMLQSKIDHKAGKPPEARQPPADAARRTELDNLYHQLPPEGRAAFLAAFKTATPASIWPQDLDDARAWLRSALATATQKAAVKPNASATQPPPATQASAPAAKPGKARRTNGGVTDQTRRDVENLAERLGWDGDALRGWLQREVHEKVMVVQDLSEQEALCAVTALQNELNSADRVETAGVR